MVGGTHLHFSPKSKRMDFFQNILVYIILAVAVGYLVKKFLLPKSLFASGKGSAKSCGQDDCGCH